MDYTSACDCCFSFTGWSPITQTITSFWHHTSKQRRMIQWKRHLVDHNLSSTLFVKLFRQLVLYYFVEEYTLRFESFLKSQRLCYSFSKRMESKLKANGWDSAHETYYTFNLHLAEVLKNLSGFPYLAFSTNLIYTGFLNISSSYKIWTCINIRFKLYLLHSIVVCLV